MAKVNLQIECEGVFRRVFEGPNGILDFKVYIVGPDERLELTKCLFKDDHQELYDVAPEEVESHD